MNVQVLDARKTRRNKIILLSLLGLPVLTVGISTFMFKTGIGVPTGTTNNGTLVRPAKPIAPFTMSQLDGTPYSYAKDAKWTFIIPQEGQCDEKCKERLYFTRQVHIAVGKNATALRRVYLNMNNELSIDFKEFLIAEHSRMDVVNADSAEWKAFSKDFAPESSKEKSPFYLVDPAGFVMMYYTIDNTYKEILVDLQKLISGVGSH